MFNFLEEAIADAFRVFLVGMLLYSVLFGVLLRLSFYRSRGFARNHLRNLQKLGEFMDKKEDGPGGADHELLNNLIARYQSPGMKSGVLRGPSM